MVSAVQLQISKAASNQHAYVVAYFDGFNLWRAGGTGSNDDYPHQFISSAREIFVGTEGQALEVRNDPQAPASLQVSVTGNPSLATWASYADDQQTCRRVRQQLFPHVQETTPLFLFFGGYGDEYNETLRLFASVVQAANGSAAFALSQHPGQVAFPPPTPSLSPPSLDSRCVMPLCS
jgi:hypothetical protein